MSKRKFAKLGEERIPLVRDVATWIYLEDADAPGWPDHPVTCVLADLAWLEEGNVVELEDLRPEYPHMGIKTIYRVIANRASIQLHSGKYGQMQRRVLIAENADEADLDTFVEEHQ